LICDSFSSCHTPYPCTDCSEDKVVLSRSTLPPRSLTARPLVDFLALFSVAYRFPVFPGSLVLVRSRILDSALGTPDLFPPRPRDPVLLQAVHARDPDAPLGHFYFLLHSLKCPLAPNERDITSEKKLLEVALAYRSKFAVPVHPFLARSDAP